MRWIATASIRRCWSAPIIQHNPANNAYIAGQRERHPDRIQQLVDLDSFWSPTYRTPGGAARLTTMLQRWPLAGFTHYLATDDDGSWLLSAEGSAIFEVAAQSGLLASIHCQPQQLDAITTIAGRFPSVPILLHHLGHPKMVDEETLARVLACARCDNLHVKISGFYYATTGPKWDFPFQDTLPFVRQLYQHFGAQRLCWGSDYPVVSRFMTYQQALELFRTRCNFIPPHDQAKILGQNQQQLLRQSG